MLKGRTVNLDPGDKKIFIEKVKTIGTYFILNSEFENYTYLMSISTDSLFKLARQSDLILFIVEKALSQDALERG